MESKVGKLPSIIRRWKIHLLMEERLEPIEVSGIFYLQIILSSLTRLEVPYSIKEIKDRKIV